MFEQRFTHAKDVDCPRGIWACNVFQILLYRTRSWGFAQHEWNTKQALRRRTLGIWCINGHWTIRSIGDFLPWCALIMESLEICVPEIKLYFWVWPVSLNKLSRKKSCTRIASMTWYCHERPLSKFYENDNASVENSIRFTFLVSMLVLICYGTRNEEGVWWLKSIVERVLNQRSITSHEGVS